MNPQKFSLRNQTILVLCIAFSIFALNGSSVLTQIGSTTSIKRENRDIRFNSPSQREMGIGVPKHIPIKIKIKNITNERWANDLEVEITNKSDKPIYYLSFLVKPQSTNVEDEKVAFWIHYGRPELNNFSTPVESTDVPLLPNDSCVLKIPESQADGWETFRTTNNKPQPVKVGLVFQVLNFGDGTGFLGTQGTPVDRNKRSALMQGCLSPPLRGIQEKFTFLPAVLLPVNFLSSPKTYLVLSWPLQPVVVVMREYIARGGFPPPMNVRESVIQIIRSGFIILKTFGVTHLCRA